MLLSFKEICRSLPLSLKSNGINIRFYVNKFRDVLRVVNIYPNEKCWSLLLGASPASFFPLRKPPMKMEQCPETSAYKILTPGNHPKSKNTAFRAGRNFEIGNEKCLGLKGQVGVYHSVYAGYENCRLPGRGADLPPPSRVPRS